MVTYQDTEINAPVVNVSKRWRLQNDDIPERENEKRRAEETPAATEPNSLACRPH